YQAGKGTSAHNKSGSVFIGKQAGFNETASNRLYIENSSSATPLIYGEFDNDVLRVNGELQVGTAYALPTADGSSSQVLKTDGAGQLSWQDEGPVACLEGVDTVQVKLSGLAAFVFDSSRISFMNNEQNIFIGSHAGLNTMPSPNPINFLGKTNIFVGDSSGFANTVGAHNLFIGNRSGLNAVGYSNTFLGHSAGVQSSGSANTFVGYFAGNNTSTGQYNAFMGSEAGQHNTEGSTNVAIGGLAGKHSTTGSHNAFLGYGAGQWNSSGGGNVFVGRDAGLFNGTGESNIYIGYNAAPSTANDSFNVIIGANAGFVSNDMQTSNHNILIGHRAGNNVAFDGADSTLIIESSGSATPLIYGRFDNDWLQVNGRFTPTEGVTDEDGDTRIQVEENADEDVIRFDVAGTEKMYLDPDGKVVLNNSVNDEMTIINHDEWEHATGVQDFGNDFSGGDHFIMASKETSGESAGIFGNGDHVTIWSPGDAAAGQPAALLYILDEDGFDNDTDPYDNGALQAYLNTSGTWIASDRNRKSGIRPLQHATDKIRKLGTYAYHYNAVGDERSKPGDSPEVLGVIAQELKQTIPQAVQINDHGEHFVNYDQLIPVLIEATKEQQTEIEDLKQQVASLLARLELLENK
ncbi:MAG: tail fiber domain-containing protein, partial [Saprospiraceae bacterium]|nr:tail fiber domain-containing protein [Saprospiraceae bacterium]